MPLHFRYVEKKKRQKPKLAVEWRRMTFQISWGDWRWLYFVGVAPSPSAKSPSSSLLCWKKKANFCRASCRFLKQDTGYGYAPSQPTGGKQHLAMNLRQTYWKGECRTQTRAIVAIEKENKAWKKQTAQLKSLFWQFIKNPSNSFFCFDVLVFIPKDPLFYHALMALIWWWTFIMKMKLKFVLLSIFSYKLWWIGWKTAEGKKLVDVMEKL